MRQQKKCKECKSAYVAIGLQSRLLTCPNRPGSDGRWFIVEPDGWCPNFKPRHEDEWFVTRQINLVAKQGEG
jgi:hypothetical protein